MSHSTVFQAALFDELEKIAASKAQHRGSKTRSGVRPLRVDTLLRKEKNGTLWKIGEGSVGNSVPTAANDPPNMTGSPAKYDRTSSEVPSRDDGREHVATVPGPGRTVLAPAAVNYPEERTNN